MEQKSFASLAYDNKEKKTHREKFLEEMDKVIPWSLLIKPIKKHYPKAGNGRQPYALETMLRIYFMQQWCQLSDHKWKITKIMAVLGLVFPSK